MCQPGSLAALFPLALFKTPFTAGTVETPPPPPLSLFFTASFEGLPHTTAPLIRGWFPPLLRAGPLRGRSPSERPHTPVPPPSPLGDVQRAGAQAAPRQHRLRVGLLMANALGRRREPLEETHGAAAATLLHHLLLLLRGRRKRNRPDGRRKRKFSPCRASLGASRWCGRVARARAAAMLESFPPCRRPSSTRRGKDGVSPQNVRVPEGESRPLCRAMQSVCQEHLSRTGFD